MYIVTPPRLAKLATTITILNAVSVEISNQKNSGKVGEIKGFNGDDLNRLHKANLYAVACAFNLQNEPKNQELKADYDALIVEWKNCQIRAFYTKNTGDPDAHY